jgi:hypothetical protein
MARHADGYGVSFLPDAAFDPGETVTVHVEAVGGSAAVTHRFGVVRPTELPPAPTEHAVEGDDDPVHAWRSRPDLEPPVIDITTPATGTGDGYIFLSISIGNGKPGLAIIDETGQYVWYNPPRVGTESVYNLAVHQYRGEPVLGWAEAASPRGYGFGHFVLANAAYERIAEIRIGNGYPGGDVHDLIITPRDTAVVGIYHPVEWDLSSVGGSRYGTVLDNIVQEVEIETGRVLFEWHSLDHVAVDESYKTAEGDSDTPFDYFHLNSIFEAEDGSLIISARHTSAIYRIDRSTGEVAWRLNGRRSDFRMGDGASFAWQHDARLHANGQLSLFDNAEIDQALEATTRSSGMVLDLDLDAKTATLAEEYVHPTEILSVSQGNTQLLPNGNVFVGWGSAPVFSEFSADGELIFNGRMPAGANSYRAYRLPWTGEPGARPDIAVVRRGTGQVGVYASWNGATEVATWRVLAGDQPATLSEVTTAPRGGFETEINAQTDAAYVAVEALNASGAIIGASEAMPTGA